MEAANLMRKINSAESIKLMEEAIEIYVKENKLANAAKTKKTIGEIYESDSEFTMATKYFQDAEIYI